MSNLGGRERQQFVDRIANAAMPRIDSNAVSQRPAWWWVFFMPAKSFCGSDTCFLGGSAAYLEVRAVEIFRCSRFCTVSTSILLSLPSVCTDA